MKIKIVKCSKDTYWYKTRIGEIFEVNEVAVSDSKRGRIRTYILGSDCEAVKSK